MECEAEGSLRAAQTRAGGKTSKACETCQKSVGESVGLVGKRISSRRECRAFPYTRRMESGSKGLRAWMLLSRPRGAREYSVFQPGTGCPREPPRCPGNSTAVQDTQSRGYGLTETAARLRLSTSRQGLPSSPVLNSAVPLATQHCEMLTFSSSRVPSGTGPAK